jgi:glycosyltransferase involved in cell wall biosynthesis
MHILFASERPPYPFFLGGAARSAHQILLAIAGELGGSCSAMGSSDYSVTPWRFPTAVEQEVLGIRSIIKDDRNPNVGTVCCGYPVHIVSDFEKSLRLLIGEFRPQVVWAQLEGAHAVVEIAHEAGIQGLLFIHDAEFDVRELRATAAFGCHVVCSSVFLAEKASRVIGRPADVVYPPAIRYFDISGDPNGYVTMINPHRVKGLDTFLEIARRMPQTRFLLLESWKLADEAVAALKAELKSLPNVRFERRVTDMRAIYGETRLLLVPSRWEEGFGMVAIEAQSCGIPVIASARGGLPESVGDGGILIEDYTNPDGWVKAISQVLDDDTTYHALAMRARKHAAADTFAALALARKLLTICANKPPGAGALPQMSGAPRRRFEQLPLLGRLLRRS